MAILLELYYLSYILCSNCSDVNCDTSMNVHLLSTLQSVESTERWLLADGSLHKLCK